MGAGTGQRRCGLTAVCQPRRSPQALPFSPRYPGICVSPSRPPFLLRCSPVLAPPANPRLPPVLLLQAWLLSQHTAGISNPAGFPADQMESRQSTAEITKLFCEPWRAVRCSPGCRRHCCSGLLWETLWLLLLHCKSMPGWLLTWDPARFAPREPKNESRISPVLTGVPKRRHGVRELLKVKGLRFHC